MLSDRKADILIPGPAVRLNAPSGAQCFPTLLCWECGWEGRLGSQCTFWCSVLSDLQRRSYGDRRVGGSQCTFWCSVLSDGEDSRRTWVRFRCLNAPSGAQCFPTAFLGIVPQARAWSQCTFWCSVLSDVVTGHERKAVEGLNAPSGAQCFPTRGGVRGVQPHGRVSMHLLVLSAFRQEMTDMTRKCPETVSMHLLVLSAFRLRPQKTAPQRRLPERNRRRPGKHHIESARTCPIKPHNREKPPQNDPAPPAAPTSQYATDFQRTQAKKPTPHNYAAVNTATKATDNCPCADTTDRFPLTAALRPSAVFMSTVSRPWRSHGGPGRT